MTSETDAVQHVVNTVARQLINREGDLHLTLVAPVVERLSEPGAGWRAVLTLLAELQRAGRVPAVRSITDVRENPAGRFEVVRLPVEAEALLERGPVGSGWLGAELVAPGRPAWLLDERVVQARLRDRPDPLPDLRSQAELVTGTDGGRRGVALWPVSAPPSRRGTVRPVLPPELVGVWAESRHGELIVAGRTVQPAEIALLLNDLELSDRPVLLIPAIGEGGLASFAARLSRVVGQPVMAALHPVRG